MEQKPIILEMDEAKRELVQCVNEIMQRHGLNCYLMEPMFAELHTEMKSMAQKEISLLRAQETAKEKGAARVAPNNTK